MNGFFCYTLIKTLIWMFNGGLKNWNHQLNIQEKLIPLKLFNWQSGLSNNSSWLLPALNSNGENGRGWNCLFGVDEESTNVM